MKPILRFAPSPTGWLHIGNIRTALMNWLFVQKHEGTFWLRMDDTDLARSKPEYVEGVKEDLLWLGLKWDKYTEQSSRFPLYEEAVKKLKGLGRLYPCYETQEELDFMRKMQLARSKPPIYDRSALKLTPEDIQKLEASDKKPHWRFKLDDRPISWDDALRGKIIFNEMSFSDPVLVKEDGYPVYTLASVVDDIDLGITHVIRGEDHIANTAVQIQLFEALGKKIEDLTFGHLQLITDISGEGFSKREGSLSIRSLREQGVEPLAICAMLAKMGTSDSIEQKHNLQELITELDFSKFGKSSPKFDLTELEMLSRKTLHHFSYFQALPRLKELNIELSEDLWRIFGGNITKLDDLHYWMSVLDENTTIAYTPFGENDSLILKTASEVLDTLESSDLWHDLAQEVSTRTGLKGKVLFMPLRLALTGKEKGPEMKDFMTLVDKKLLTLRLQKAIESL